MREPPKLVESYFLGQCLRVDFSTEARPTGENARQLKSSPTRLTDTGLDQLTLHLTDGARQARDLQGKGTGSKRTHDHAVVVNLKASGFRYWEVGVPHRLECLRADEPEYMPIARLVVVVGESRRQRSVEHLQQRRCSPRRSDDFEVVSISSDPHVGHDHALVGEQSAVEEGSVPRCF